MFAWIGLFTDVYMLCDTVFLWQLYCGVRVDVLHLLCHKNLRFLWCKESGVWYIPLNYLVSGSFSCVSGFCEASCNAEQATVLELPGVCMLWYDRTSARMATFRLKNGASFLDVNNTISADFAIKKTHTLNYTLKFRASHRDFQFISYDCTVTLLRASIQLLCPAMPGLTWHVKWKEQHFPTSQKYWQHN